MANNLTQVQDIRIADKFLEAFVAALTPLRALLDLQTEALSAFAVWDKESGRRLERLRKLLGEQVEPPQQATTEDLEDVFAAWGAGSG